MRVRMRMRAGVGVITLLVYVVSVAGGIAFSIWMATLCHPTAVWFWDDMLGVVSVTGCG